MANISHFTQTVNGVSTTYDIHDANAVDLTNNQTVGGIKTFSNAPVVSAINLDGKTIDTDANSNMVYDSHIVDTIEEQGNEYIRYSNGLQICWGTMGSSNVEWVYRLFPKPFIDTTIYMTATQVYTTSDRANFKNAAVGIEIYNSSTFSITVYSSANWQVNFYAIGRWK